jgi:hypothetical protein
MPDGRIAQAHSSSLKFTDHHHTQTSVSARSLIAASERGSKSESMFLRPTVSRPVCYVSGNHLGAATSLFLSSMKSMFRHFRFLLWGAISDEWMGLKFTVAAGPHQGSLSQVYLPSADVKTDWLLNFCADSVENCHASLPGCSLPVYVSCGIIILG